MSTEQSLAESNNLFRTNSSGSGGLLQMGVGAYQLADQNRNASWTSVLGVLAAIICCTWAILTFAL